ncbi:MAG: ArsA family ATPase [Bdellovibrionia bacterium]
MSSFSEIISPVLGRNLIFVHGKGGVGKTALSHAIALRLSEKGKRTLWTTFEDPTRPAGEIVKKSECLTELNCDFTQSFEEYASMKIGSPALTRIFLQNKLMRYMSKAAPGIHELVLLGKIWFERNHYDHIVIDMPSTGYGIAMFQSTENFVKLFHGGPLHKDAEAMIETFKNPKITAHLIVALPEEMPLRESLELSDHLKNLFPKNPAWFFANRLFPSPSLDNVNIAKTVNIAETPQDWPTPIATSTEEYARKRYLLENHNLRLWRDAEINFGELGYAHISGDLSSQASAEKLIQNLASQIRTKAYL